MFFKIGILKISQISSENTCVEVSLIKLQVFRSFFYRTPPVAASGFVNGYLSRNENINKYEVAHIIVK